MYNIFRKLYILISFKNTLNCSVLWGHRYLFCLHFEHWRYYLVYISWLHHILVLYIIMYFMQQTERQQSHWICSKISTCNFVSFANKLFNSNILNLKSYNYFKLSIQLLLFNPFIIVYTYKQIIGDAPYIDR